MPTFVLKKYEPTETKTEQVEGESGGSDGQPATDSQKQEAFIEINATDSIGKIIVQALHKALPNVDITERNAGEKAEQDDTKVISTEDINKNPVDTLQLVRSSKHVLIMGEGFKTQKDEWFLQSLENLGIEVFYTVGSFSRHIAKKLG